MATYAIGDIQGCFLTFLALLERIGFNADRDRLWLVGDLVNRGPRSLEMLRWARAHDSQLVCVLGNHDLHLLSAAAGLRTPKPRDTLGLVLEAHDRDELLQWLGQRPLMHQETLAGRELLMVHAGLHPGWTASRALALAEEARAGLSAGDGGVLLKALTKGAPSRWDDTLAGEARLAMTVSVLTRLRCCRNDGTLDPDYTGPPADAPRGWRAWHALPDVAWSDHRIVCGHWAAQGLLLSERVIALDSGCVWGGTLTACRLEDEQLFSVQLQDEQGA